MQDPSAFQEVRRHVPAKTLGLSLPPGYHLLKARSGLILCFGDAEIRAYAIGEDLKQIARDAIEHAARQHVPPPEAPPPGLSAPLDPRTGLPWTHAVSAEVAKLVLERDLHAICIQLAGLDTLIEVHGYQAPQAVLRQAASAVKRLLNDGDHLTRHSADKLLIFTTRPLDGVETLVNTIHQEIAGVALEAGAKRLPQCRIGVASLARVDDPAQVEAFVEAVVISAEGASAGMQQREPEIAAASAPPEAIPELPAVLPSAEAVEPPAPAEPPRPSGTSPSAGITGPAPKAVPPKVPSVPLPAESPPVAESVAPTGPKRELLAEMLVEAGAITEAQLREALTEQGRTGKRLGRILIERGYISEDLLGQFLEGQGEFEYIDLNTNPIDEHLVRSLPEWMVLQHKVLPIARVGDEVHLAMLDPTDVVAIDNVGQFLGARARPFLITKRDFDWALTKFFDAGRLREAETAPASAPAAGAPELTATSPSPESAEPRAPVEPPLSSGTSPTSAVAGSPPEAVAPQVPSARVPAESPVDVASGAPVAPRRKLLGEMLVEAGAITEAQLREALTEQERTGERLGRILIERGYISRQALGQILEAQRGIPYVNLGTHPIDEHLVRSLPEWMVMQHKVLPIARVGDEVHLAMLDPTDVVAMDSVGQFLGGRTRPFLITEGDFDWALTKFFDVGRKVDRSVLEVAPGEMEKRGATSVTMTESLDAPPVVRVLNSIVHDAVRIGATDVHIEPGVDEARVRVRVDGLLQDKAVLPWGVAEAVASRLKVLAGMDIAERSMPQDGRVLLDVEGREYDLRIATVGTAFGERVAIRLLNPQQVLLGLERLGLFPEQEEILKGLLLRPHGMILVTGPTGSGKTTTLYAAISRANDQTRNIMTIEDPVEYRMSGITQIPVREKTGITFGRGLRAILRQDPDVVMVGEIRDPETASIAIQAALTGHLVLSTLHTNNAAGALVRLLDMGSQPYLLTSSILAVVGQRLIRVLCTACKHRYRPRRGSDLELLGLPGDADVTLFGPVGCPECANLGYKGRTGVFEVMVMNDPIRELVLQRKPTVVMMDAAQAAGMQTLRMSTVRKVLDGVTSIEELQRLILAEVH